MLVMRKQKRHALKSLYYFCRAVDDAVDNAQDRLSAHNNISFWRKELESIYTQRASNPHVITQALANTIATYHLPRQPFEDLLHGMEFDCAEIVQIHTEQELEKYCYCVAGAVGLQAMLLFGVNSENGNAFAIKLGLALQLTNILRDIRKDAAMNRHYIPYEWGRDKRSKLILKIESVFLEVERLSKSLPNRPLMPALLMRDIYYQKFLKLKNGKLPKQNFGLCSLRLMPKAWTYYFR